ncbi:MAG: DUF192 domain-containing protein [bacterium]|nr:DUF192 domain-containing protein [bacterium]
MTMRQWGITVFTVLMLGMFGERAWNSVHDLVRMDAGGATITISRAAYEARAEVARTPAARRQGLSGRDALAADAGLLIVFDMLDQHRIWMKDMRFSIDLIWIAGGVVVDTHEQLPVPSPGRDPASLPYFNPRPQALFVLEVPAGTVAKYGIIHGDQVRIDFDAKDE